MVELKKDELKEVNGGSILLGALAAGLIYFMLQAAYDAGKAHGKS
jgi:lactobin A/cerein 7B family class IIb bacteriocin